MEYRVMRVAANANGWLKPAPGRLGRSDCGQFVSDNGFGDEDWNFNVTRPISGCIFGYARGEVKKKLLSAIFAIVLATYDSRNGWMMVGYYKRATRVQDDTPLPNGALKMRCEDVLELGGSGNLGGRYSRLDSPALYKALEKEARYNHWRVRVEDVFVCSDPVPIPPRVCKPIWRMTKSLSINGATFRQLISLARGSSLAASEEELATPSDQESDFPEGALKSRRHRYRERDGRIVRQAKAAFRSSNKGRLFCQACGCDFLETYGEDYIEAHHMVPISKLDGKSGKTNISALAMVCANCHRMLHRRRPWISQIKDLPKVLLKNQ